MSRAEELELEEKEFVLDSFDAEQALTMGLAMIEEAKRRNNKISLDITAFGRQLFHFSSTGNAPSNDEMIRRKRNTTLYTGHSSLWAHEMLKGWNLTIDQKWHLDPSDYAEVGGSFPLRMKNGGGVIGAVTVSGFAHTEDHEMAVYGVRYLLVKI